MAMTPALERTCAGLLLTLLTACDESARAASSDRQATARLQAAGAPPAAAAAVKPVTFSLPALSQQAPFTIEYYGASSVWGAESGNTSRQVAVTAPEAFQAGIVGKFPHSIVINHGINGTTARDWLTGSAAVGIPWAERMKASGAAIVIVQLGVNDSNSYPVKEYVAALDGLVRQAHEAGKTIILETPGPVDNKALAPYAAAMIELAARHKVPLIDQYSHWTAWMAANRVKIRNLVPDGTHPSEAWYIEKGKYAAGVFQALHAMQGGRHPAHR
jgi:lysophospholipase L1-like esterase